LRRKGGRTGWRGFFQLNDACLPTQTQGARPKESTLCLFSKTKRSIREWILLFPFLAPAVVEIVFQLVE
jgi:hypothetical protein